MSYKAYKGIHTDHECPKHISGVFTWTYCILKTTDLMMPAIQVISLSYLIFYIQKEIDKQAWGRVENN